jgi:hypothetical protein
MIEDKLGEMARAVPGKPIPILRENLEGLADSLVQQAGGRSN